MIEAYRIGINLALSGSISSDIGKVSGQFDALNIVLRTTRRALSDLAGDMRGLRDIGVSAATAWKSAADAMERAARAAAQAASPSGAGGFAAPTAGSGMAIVAAALAARQQSISGGGAGSGGPLLLAPPGRGGTFAGGPGSFTGSPLTAGGVGGGGRGAGQIPLNFTPRPGFPATPSSGDLAISAIGFGAAGSALLGFVRNVTSAGEEVGHLQAQLRGLGFTQSQSEQARTMALEEQRQTPGITTPGALEIIRDMMAVTQSAKEALNPEYLHSLSRAGVILSAAGKGDALHELFKSMQMGELRGVLKTDANGEVSTGEFLGFLKNVVNTSLVTGGRVGPAEQLQYLKSAGLSGAMMSNSSLFADSIAPILSMGAARAGTGAQAFAQQFAAGKMSDAGANLLLSMGLLTIPAGHEMSDYKSGIGQYRFPPSVLTGYEQARSHPTDWIMRTLLPDLDNYMTATNGKSPANDEELLGNRMAASAMVASRIPAGNLIGDIVRNFGLTQRDRNAVATGMTRDYWTNAQTDPQVKMQALSAALNGLFASLGGPVMNTTIGIVQNLTNALNTMSSWAQAHPDTAARVVEVATALGTLSVALAGIAGAMFVLGPALRVAKWGLGFPGAAAAAAGAGGGATAAAAGALRYGIRGGLYGYAAHTALGMVDPNDATGSWIDRNIPGASWLDNMASHVGLGRSYSEQARSVAPSTQPHDMTVNMNGKVMLDGKAVGNIVASGLAKTLSGPSAGTTSFDVRAGTVGSNAAAP